MTIFRWVAGSTPRLIIASLAGLGLVFGAARPLTDHIRFVSSSPVGDMLLLTILAFTILGTASALAVLVGDNVFPGRWRERVILGQDVVQNIPDDSLEAVKSLNTYYIHFAAMIVAFILVSIWGFNALTNDFFSDFQRFGRIRSTLRGEDTASKLNVLGELSVWRRDDTVPGALEILDMTWRDARQPDEVRRASLETLGLLGVYLSSSVDEWRRENRHRSWQGDLLVELRRNLAPDLRAALPDAAPTLRPGIVFALGAIRDPRSLEILLSEVRAFPDESSDEWRAAIIALGRLRAPSSLSDIAALAGAHKNRGDAAETILAWTVSEIVRSYYIAQGPEGEPTEEARAAFGALVSHYGSLVNGESPTQRCLAAVVLKHLRDQRSRPLLFKAFDQPGTATLVCGADVFVAGGDSHVYLSDSGEPLRQRLLNALGLVAVGDDTVLDWARDRLGRASDDSKHTRDLLQDLIKQVERANSLR